MTAARKTRGGHTPQSLRDSSPILGELLLPPSPSQMGAAAFPRWPFLTYPFLLDGENLVDWLFFANFAAKNAIKRVPCEVGYRLLPPSKA